MYVPYSSSLALLLRQGGDAPRVDLMTSQTNAQFLIVKTLLASDATQDAIRVTFWNVSEAKTAGGIICLLIACS